LYTVYGDGSQGELIQLTRRRNGNTSSRQGVIADDYLGNIEWRGAQAGGAGPAGSRYPKIAPRVDSTYVADTPAIPAGIDFLVTTNTDYITHSFYSNGEVSFANAVSAGGDVTASNVQVNTNGFMKLATYTVTELTAITGQAGWMACVTDSGSGGNPNGMIAFWDTTNSRWSYVHDNNAV